MKDLGQKIDTLTSFLDGGPKRITLLAHTNPDGDAIGSSLAWATVLRSLGHSVTCLVPNKYPSFLSWMSGIKEVVIAKDSPDAAIAAIDEAEIIFFMDFNSIDRLENLSNHIIANTSAKRVLIDHHLNTKEEEYTLVFSDSQTCSTSYLVYQITEKLTGIDILNTDAAESLYVGIMTDTGNFSFSFLTTGLFSAVATLVEKGIDIPKINSLVYNSYSEGRMRLLGYVLMTKMQIIENNTVAYIALRENELRRFNFQVGDSEGFVNYPLSISSVKMSAMFLETHKFIRISFRSQGDVDVNRFAAKYFEGGGHKNASGGKSYESMENTIEKYKTAIAEYFGEEKK